MINYYLLYKSIEYYVECSFQRIEAPWTVTPAISNITKPTWVEEPEKFILKSGKELVASGEQSFLYLYNKGFLPEGRFQTVTPCFRNDSFDETHTKYFMKNELIDTINVNAIGLESIISDAYNFFARYVTDKNKLLVRKIDDENFDIEYNGVEIGSYGIRECSFLRWVFGTGLAEPRFSRIIGVEKWHIYQNPKATI